YQDIAQSVDPADSGTLIISSGGARDGCRWFCGGYPERRPDRLRFLFRHVGCQYVGADTLYVLLYRDRVAAGHRQLLLVIPFEAVARRYHIGCRGELHSFAGDDAHLLIDIPDSLVADDGLRFSLDRDMPIGVEAIDLGVAPRALARTIMGGQRVGG